MSGSLVRLSIKGIAQNNGVIDTRSGSGPSVGGWQHCVCTENLLTLVGDVSHVGELVAVKLEDVAQSLLLANLTGEAVFHVVGVQVQKLNLSKVVEGLLLV